MDKSEPRWTSSPVSLHAVQCAQCLKWRVVPTKEHYEAIREHILEQPWVCENAAKWRPESHCDIPADIEQDQTMLWAIDKPNLPSAPRGWERQITVRTDGSSKFADVYYTTPRGTRLRSKVEIEKYIEKHPDSVPPETTMDQFSFAIPRPLPGICPQLTTAGGKLASTHNSHGQLHSVPEQLAIQPAQNSSPEDLAPLSLADSGDGHPLPLALADDNSQQLHQVTPISPQRTEQRPFSSKHWKPDIVSPSSKRTKEQIKKDRQGMEVLSSPQLDRQVGAPPTSHITYDKCDLVIMAEL